MEKSGKHTLIIVRRVLVEPKIVLAGVMFELLSAIFEASTAAFNAEMAPSRPLGRWDPVAMVEGRGSCMRTARGEGCHEEG